MHLQLALRAIATILLLLLLLAPTFLGTSYQHGSWNAGGETASIIPKASSNTYTSFIYVVLPVDKLPSLAYVRLGSLYGYTCIGREGHYIAVKMLPRRIVATFLVSANATVLMPELGEPYIKPDDILVAAIPMHTVFEKPGRILTGRPGSPESSVSTWFTRCRSLLEPSAKLSVHITVPVEAPILTSHGPARLTMPVSFTIHIVDEYSPLAGVPVIADINDLEKLGRLVGLVAPPRAGDPGKLAKLWNSYLEELRARLLSLVAGIDIVTYVDSSIIGGPRSPKPEAFIGQGSRQTNNYYHFSLIIAKTLKLDTPKRVEIYMGYGVEKVILFLKARGDGGYSGLTINVRVTEAYSGRLLWSHSYSYLVDAFGETIYIMPKASWPDKPLNITVEFRPAFGYAPYISVAVLNFYKVWAKMPTEQTRQAIQLLSTGIAYIRDPYSGRLPPGCLKARASEFLEPTTYPIGFGGYMGPGYMKSITIDSSMMNGLYYDASGKTSPILYVDVCVRSRYVAAGTIAVKVNGVLYESKSVTLTPPYAYVGFTIFLGPHPVSGHGPLITIEYSFPEDIEVYIDAYIKYLYAPEVWREESKSAWFRWRSPWAKLLLYQYRGSHVEWESAIVVDTHAFSDVTFQSVLIKHRISVEEGGSRVLSAGLSVKPPIKPSWVSCRVRHGEGFSPDPYIGAAATVWGLISTGLEIATLVGIAVPEPISKGAAIASLALTVLTSALERKTVEYVNGYYVCKWLSGLSQYKWVELELLINFGWPSPNLKQPFVVKAEANDMWILRGISVSIPYYQYNVVAASSDEKYFGFYGRSPDEVIYD